MKAGGGNPPAAIREACLSEAARRGCRQLLLTDLLRYALAWPEHDGQTLRQYRSFVEATVACFERSHQAGHCTGSALISCPRGEKVLLLFHPFLQRWLQPGGHADGDGDLLAVASREAHEETGLPLDELTPYPIASHPRTPLDLDVHAIPARGKEPSHLHYDLRFLLIADPQALLTPETAELQLAWLSLEEVAERTDEESVLRMLRKLRQLPRDRSGRLL